MLLNLKLFLSIFFIGLVVDYLWIGVIAKNFYLRELNDLARLTPEGKLDVVLWSAFLVYVLLVLGTVFFVLPKVTLQDSYLLTIAWGFFFGIIVYGVYDFTNYATLARWPVLLTFVDCLWGGTLCAFLATTGKYLRDSIF